MLLTAARGTNATHTSTESRLGTSVPTQLQHSVIKRRLAAPPPSPKNIHNTKSQLIKTHSQDLLQNSIAANISLKGVCVCACVCEQVHERERDF